MRVLLPGCASQLAPGHGGTDPVPGGEPPCGGDTTALPWEWDPLAVQRYQ
jgi:hypothetical protein